MERKKYAVCGVSSRAMYGYITPMMRQFSNCAELVGMLDIDPLRFEVCRERVPETKGVPCYSAAEFEKMLYAGIASDKSGNLRKASASDLQKYLSQKRLTRQRISQILSSKTRVSRYDLMTLVFYNISMECDPDTKTEERFNAFVSSVNSVMDRCHMGRLNIANPYESFLLMCMLTNGPLIAFGDVWDFSYENDLGNG